MPTLPASVPISRPATTRRLRALIAAGLLLIGAVPVDEVSAEPGDPPSAYTDAAAFHADAGATTSAIDFAAFYPGGGSSCGGQGTPIPNPYVAGGVTFSHPLCLTIQRQMGSFVDPQTDELVEWDSMGLIPRTPGDPGHPVTLDLTNACGIGFHPRNIGGSASSKLDATATATGGGSVIAVSQAGQLGRSFFLGFWSPDGLTSVTFNGFPDFQYGRPPIDLIELVSCGGPSDADGDGVPDTMDVAVSMPPASVGFSDAVSPDAPALGVGTSAVIAPNGLDLVVEDVNPGVASSAVRLAASGTGGPMTIVPCGLAVTLFLDAGDTVTVDCGSVSIVVEEGDGITGTAGEATIAIPTGVSATLDISGGSTVVSNVSGGSVQVAVDGVTTSVSPGSPPAAFLTGHDFVGFAQPVDAYPVPNAAKSGSAIPLHWRVVDTLGNPVTTIANVTVATRLSGACTGGVMEDQIEVYVASNQSGLQNLGNGYYQLNWKTNKAWGGSCRQLVLTLDGAIVLDANPVFRFK